MIQTRIFQGLYTEVQAQIDAYLAEIDKVKQVTVLVVWEVVASNLDDETEYD